MTAKHFFSILALSMIAWIAPQMSSAQSLRNASNQQIGRIDADGKVSNASNQQIGRIDADQLAPIARLYFKGTAPEEFYTQAKDAKD
jgi:hypothetical protein